MTSSLRSVAPAMMNIAIAAPLASETKPDRHAACFVLLDLVVARCDVWPQRTGEGDPAVDVPSPFANRRIAARRCEDDVASVSTFRAFTGVRHVVVRRTGANPKGRSTPLIESKRQIGIAPPQARPADLRVIDVRRDCQEVADR